MLLDTTGVARAVAIADAGYSQRRIVRMLGVPRTTVRDTIRRFRQTGLYTRRPGQGRHRCTSTRDDRFVVSDVLRNRFCTATEARTRLFEVRNVSVSERTIRWKLAERNLRAFRPARALQLLPQHRRPRLAFAREYGNWTMEQWKNVLFSNESRIALRGPDGRQRVYRRKKERFTPCAMTETVGYQGGSIMIWGGISYEARTELVIFDRGSVNAQRYVEEVLQDHVITFTTFIGENFRLMHDNARCHVARSFTEYFDEAGIQTLPWPARSPDLNPIQYTFGTILKDVFEQDYQRLRA
ncbi:unnamed protein product [Euphydryas editha]|uniref:Transposase n=1 Tax=Euphydryas editha TaxID=104508 RepID=A0AAU9UNS7_EUPED|nr:unnamed protein product [Euphydryas editha]